MQTKNSIHSKFIVGVYMTALLISASPSRSRQNAEAVAIVTEKFEPTSRRDPAPKTLSQNAERIPLSPAKKVECDKITSFFVHAGDSKRIQLSMLVTYKLEFIQAVRTMLEEKVTPLLFSVSTLPNRTAHFDPTLLRFEQRGRVWQPQGLKKSIDIWSLEEGHPFGGTLSDDHIHQGVILLPEWFDPQTPITVRYGDFHYLARFAGQEQ
jgi:hypothetical protein